MPYTRILYNNIYYRIICRYYKDKNVPSEKARLPTKTQVAGLWTANEASRHTHQSKEGPPAAMDMTGKELERKGFPLA